MWRRHRRRTFAPRRPAVLGEQWPLIALTALVIVFGVGLVAYVLIG